ncbi:hypothetical protein [Micromonospora sp. CA-246542]|uniref:hypothetical protein n=1 Tax=Micromonospora sp. CA-246542 TaxID=3239959 RepID=UPI003D89DA7B
MLTAGIDLAAEATNTAVAWIRWAATGAVVEDLVVGADDDLVCRSHPDLRHRHFPAWP